MYPGPGRAEPRARRDVEAGVSPSRTLPWLALCLAALPWAAARADYLQVPNQRIDRALYHAHGPREVLAVRIEAVRERSDGMDEGMPYHRDLDARVEGVVLGDAARKGRLLRLTSAFFDWPADLVPLEAGARFLVILDPERHEEGEDGRILTVVPTRRADHAPVATREAAKRVLADSILTELADAKDDARRRALLLQVGPILEKEDAGRVRPFLEAHDPWVRRAALAVLAYATGAPEDVEAAAADLRAFLSSTKAGDLVPAAAVHGEDGASYAPYPLLFDHYLYLVTDWSEEERERLPSVAPLARVVATGLQDDEWMRWRHGVACLAFAGTEQDADLLWAYLVRLREDTGHPLHHDLRARVTLLDGLSRVLGIENEAYLASGVPASGGPGETIVGEDAQVARIRETLASR